MLFKLCNIPGTWQVFINNILREYLNMFVIIYLNNILIYSTNKEEHVIYIRKILKAIKKANL